MWENIQPSLQFTHNSIKQHKAFEEFDTINALIDSIPDHSSIIVQKGSVSIIDATVIKALNNRSNKNKAGKKALDKDASYNVKIGSDGKLKTTYGFKGHIACDGYGFVTQTVVTTGKLLDSQIFEELLTGNEVEVYADSAYASVKTAQQPESKGIENKILKRAYRNKPLTKEDKAFN